MDLNEYFRFFLRSHRPDCNTYRNGDDLPLDVDCARVRREGPAQSWISGHTHLRLLEAQAVNQELLEQIGKLLSLEYLALEHPMTAIDLAPLSALSELRILKIKSPRSVKDFTPILGLRKLERLFIENATHMFDLDWIRPMKDQLRVLGVEGSMYAAQCIPTLTPLKDFALEGLFLTNTKLVDKSFLSLRSMSSLKYFGTARNAPRAEFEALHTALPHLTCDWFDPMMWNSMNEVVSGEVNVSHSDPQMPESGLRLPPRL